MPINGNWLRRSRPQGADTNPPETAGHGLRGANSADAAASADPVSTAAKPTPEEVYANIAPKYTQPSHSAGTRFGGYQWKAEVLDDVMRRYAVGDAKELIRSAIALDQGDRYLSASELRAAGKELTGYVTRGHKWSPQTLADIMESRGIAEETALLRAAKRLDDGDRFLSADEISRAADVLDGVVKANDIQDVQKRIDNCAGKPGVELETLGEIGGHPVRAVHFSHTGSSPAPKLNVVITGGVHGNEPCGTGAAVLLMEQLQADPRLREEVAFTVIPLLNPRGYAAGERRTPEDLDLNRNFHPEADHHDAAARPEEVKMLESVLGNRSFDLALDLHSGYAKRDGFWVYHRNGEELAKPAMKRFARDYPALNPDNHNRPMVAPGVIMSDMPPDPDAPHKGTLKDFAFSHGAKWSFTVEAPGSVSYLDQVFGENELVHQFVLEARRATYRASDDDSIS